MIYLIQNSKNPNISGFKIINCNRYSVYDLNKIYTFYENHKQYTISVLYP